MLRTGRGAVLTGGRRHELAQPKSSRVEGYIFELKKRLLVDRETMAELVGCFERHHGKLPGTRASCVRGVASLATKRRAG